MPALRLFSLAFVLGGVGACGATEPTAEGPLSIALVSTPVSSPIRALAPVPLTVAITNPRGEPVAGVLVEFEAVRLAAGYTLVRLATPGGPSERVALRTDDDGQASVFVRTGDVSGQTAVEVSAPLLGLSATAPIVVLPGPPAALEIQPGILVLYPGSTRTFHVRFIDVFGNPADEPVSVAISGDGLSIVADREAVAATTIGAGRLVATAGTLADTTEIAVVPPGTVAGVSEDDPAGLVLGALDGSSFTQLYWRPFLGVPVWRPSGDALVFTNDRLSADALYAIDASGTGSPRPIYVSDAEYVFGGDFAADGAWLYFATQSGFDQGSIRRLRWSDGAVETLLSAPSSRFTSPSPSPNLAAVVYQSDNGSGVWLLDVGQGTSARLAAGASVPRWSPRGDLIAMVSGATGSLAVIRPDGTGFRIVAADLGLSDPPSWSPDGEWVLVGPSLRVVRIADGLVLPVGAWPIRSGSWRPAPPASPLPRAP